jgi:sigma-54 specific flagellar transcriptional regulator A
MGDLPRIAEHLLARIAVEREEVAKGLSPDALDLLSRHRWPGNVRELENALRAASLFADAGTITATHLVENVDDLRIVAASMRPSDRPPPSMGAIDPRGESTGLLSARRPIVAFGAPANGTNGAGSGAAVPIPSSRPPVGSVESVADGDVDEGAADIEAPLPAFEANATAVAYAQVRQGAVSLSDMKRQIERDCIARALAETKGNITRAAALLGMKRPRLSQLVKQYGLAAVSSEDKS